MTLLKIHTHKILSNFLAALNKSFSAYAGHEADHFREKKCVLGWAGAGNVSNKDVVDHK